MQNQDEPAQNQSEAGRPRSQLVTIRLGEDQMREIARRLAFAGRDHEARAMNEALTRPDGDLMRVPVDEAVQIAVSAHQARDIARAESHYRAVLEAAPDHPHANHFFGVLLHQMHQSRQGLVHMRRSLQVLGDQGWAWNNFGNILVQEGHIEEAEEVYRKAIQLQPDMVDAHSNYSIICRQMDRLEEASMHADRALELNPQSAEAHISRGNIHMRMKQPDEARACFARALALQPPGEAGRSRRLLAFAYMTVGQVESAAEICRDWLADEPDNATVKHLLQACLGTDIPERCSDGFVTETFNEFANTFDVRLAHVGYRAPQLVAAALDEAYPNGASFGVVADAGCGTGLCAPLLRDRAETLIGIDLSSGMLAKARARGGYDELHEAEITAFMLDRHCALDTVISVDTLIYFGVIDGFLRAAHGAIKPGGVLVFTVEASPDDAPAPYTLNLHGRYSHRRDYVEQAVTESGFSLSRIDNDVVRQEGGIPVASWIVTAIRG